MLLLKYVKAVKDRIDEAQKQLDNIIGADTGDMRSYWSQQLDNAKNQYSIYEKQLERTKNAEVLNIVIKKVEFWLPVILAVAALSFILIDAVKLAEGN